MNASKNISLTILIFVLLASFAHTAELSKQPNVQVEGKGNRKTLRVTNRPWHGLITTKLSPKLIEERNKLLAEADMRIRSGLLKLSDKFPQLKKARDWEGTISGKSPNGRIKIWLRHTHKGKGKSTQKFVPRDKQSNVMVIILPPPEKIWAMGLFPLYPNLGLVGQIQKSAGDPELKAALKKLVDEALKPLKRLDESLSDEKAAVQIEEGNKFELIQELIISYESRNAIIDLDTNKTWGPAAQGRATDYPGVDIYANSWADTHGQYTVLSHNMLKIMPDKNGWDITATNLVKRIETVPSAENKATRLADKRDEVPKTFLFQTREGRIGVLQILGFTKTPNGVKIRHKMIEKNAVQVEGEGGWGEAVEGLRCRLRVDRRIWKAGEVPELLADAENQGGKRFQICLAEREISINGAWYDTREIGAPVLQFLPGQRHNDIEIRLNGPLYKKGSDEHIALSSGKNTIQVTFIADPIDKDSGGRARFTSNPVEVVILPAEEKHDVQVESKD